MSYKALYRTYRPNKFEDVVGQDHIVKTLQNIIKNDKVAHAYLFTGPRGTGKTSVANVFAREVNRTASGKIPETNLDIIEIDAASNNGVAEVRNIIEGTRYAPANTKYKVYIIDEVHMLSKGAFNALLKTLEEPPAHALFILATTEPHKIPVTILSRTQRFNFRRIESTEIRLQLQKVLSKEGIEYEEEALRVIAKLSNGGMRDALTIADQTSAYSGGKVTMISISQVLGVVSISKQINLINLMYSGNSSELLYQVQEIIENGSDILRLTSMLLTTIKDFIVYKKTSDAKLLEQITARDAELFNISIPFAYKATDAFIKLIGILRVSQMPRQAFELTTLKLADENEQTIIVKEAEVPKVLEENIGVFTTAELKVEKKIMSTDEIELVSEDITNEDEAISETQEIAEDILSTQEIEITSTEEIDMEAMFQPIEKTDDEGKPMSVRINDLLNMLIHSDRASLEVVKAKMIEISANASVSKFGTIVAIMEKLKPVSAGPDVILLASVDTQAVSAFNLKRNTPEMADLLIKVFGASREVYALSKEDYLSLIDNYKKLSASQSLPEKYSVNPPKPSPIQKDKQKEYATDLFGDLFKE